MYQMSRIARFALNPTTWTPIIAPIDGTYFAILGSDNGNSLIRATSQSDANQEFQTGANDPFAIIAPSKFLSQRFATGDTVYWMKSVGSNCNVIVEFFP